MCVRHIFEKLNGTTTCTNFYVQERIVWTKKKNKWTRGGGEPLFECMF